MQRTLDGRLAALFAPTAENQPCRLHPRKVLRGLEADSRVATNDSNCLPCQVGIQRRAERSPLGDEEAAK